MKKLIPHFCLVITGLAASFSICRAQETLEQQTIVRQVQIGPEKIGTTEYWPLVCEGGNPSLLRMSVSAGGNITFQFHKSANAAGRRGENLQAGECSWVERAMSSDEPGEMFIRTSSPRIDYDLGENGRVQHQSLHFSPPYEQLLNYGTRYLYVNHRNHNLYPLAVDRFDISPEKVIFLIVPR